MTKTSGTPSLDRPPEFPPTSKQSRSRRARRRGGLRLPVAAGLAGVASVAGVFALFSTAIYLYSLWTTDPLKSIGGLIPIASLVLIVRAWRALGWRAHGSWWGLVIVLGTVALVHLRDHAILELILTPSWTIFLPPHSLVAVAYTTGTVLLFGGRRLLRAAWFPVALMWFVNPVPNAFSLLIDLPLQHFSAAVARGFAHTLGQPLTPEQLKLMFTPSFGMFIAPGCSGIRGAITMGFIALVAGYLYRFRLKYHVLVVVAAVLLGYVFNLVRLCVLVLYYIAALHIPWLQSRAEMGDYILGAGLFLLAATLLFTLILRLSPTGSLRPPAPAMNQPTRDKVAPRSFVPRLAAFTLLIVLGSVSYARALIAEHRAAHTTGDVEALGNFPQHVGSYTLARLWNEHLVTGTLIFQWAEYSDAHGGANVAIGISPVLGAHDTLLCHAARGEDWLWHDTLLLRTATRPTSFSASFYNSGDVQYLEATTVCTGEKCGQYSSSRQHFGFIYSRPDTYTLLSQSPSRPVPVLLRAETIEALAPDLARTQLTEAIRAFVSAADLSAFTHAQVQR